VEGNNFQTRRKRSNNSSKLMDANESRTFEEQSRFLQMARFERTGRGGQVTEMGLERERERQWSVDKCSKKYRLFSLKAFKSKEKATTALNDSMHTKRRTKLKLHAKRSL
jgi:hypothetical protein